MEVYTCKFYKDFSPFVEESKEKISSLDFFNCFFFKAQIQEH